MEKLRVAIGVVDLQLVAIVVDMPEEAMVVGNTFTASNGWKLQSGGNPELRPNTLFLRGSTRKLDNNLCSCSYESRSKADAAAIELGEAVREYNENRARKDDGGPDEVLVRMHVYE